MSKLERSLLKYSHDASGSFKSVSDRDRHLEYFSKFLLSNNINIENINHVRVKHIKDYVENRKKEVSVATICNEIASLKKVLREANRHQLANLKELKNKELGIDGRSRVGNKLPIPTVMLNNFIEKAFLHDLSFFCCVLLGFQLGLREEESCQAYKSIPTWFKNVKNNDDCVTVIFGTKGGRSRNTNILNHKILLGTLEFCLNVMKSRNGYLIPKSNLKQAMKFISNASAEIEMTGSYTFHSLRYTYANLLKNMLDKTKLSEQEKIAIISMSLGHSAGRVNYVKSVYCRVLLSDLELNLNDAVINYPK